MVVNGLWAFCQDSTASAAFETVDSLEDVTLAVDFDELLAFWCDQLVQTHAFGATTGFGVWLLLGGCTWRLKQVASRWLHGLQSHGIQLLVQQAPPISFQGGSKWCQHRLLQRLHEQADMVQLVRRLLLRHRHVLDDLNEHLPVDQLWEAEDLLFRTNLPFPLARTALRQMLRKNQTQVTTSSRDVGSDLADRVRDGDAFAVLSDRSDYLCMEGARLIPFGSIRQQSQRDGGGFSVRVFSSDRLAKSLGIETYQLMDLMLIGVSDATQFLDERYDFAKQMGLPAQRVARSEFWTPRDTARWIREKLGSSCLCQHSKLLALAQVHDELLPDLFQLYCAFGYEQVLRENSAIAKVLPKTEASQISLAAYRVLLDKGLPRCYIDVLQSSSRRCRVRFDARSLVDACCWDGEECLGVCLDSVTASLRAVSYGLLGINEVTEWTYQVDSRSLQPRQLKSPHGRVHRPPTRYDIPEQTPALDRLVLWYLVGDANDDSTAALTAMLMKLRQYPCGQGLVKAVCALVLLKKCESQMPAEHGSLVVRDTWLDLLLATSVICLTRNNDDDNSDESDTQVVTTLKMTSDFVSWQMCLAAQGFLEVLRLLDHWSVISGLVGDDDVPNDVYSADVFFGVVSVVQMARIERGNLEWPQQEVISHADFKVIVGTFAPDGHGDSQKVNNWHAPGWQMYLDANAVRRLLHSSV